MNYNRFLSILSGRFENLPKKNSKVVRIFLSSTFTDTHEERDYLIQHIFPQLRNYCKLEYGIDFQILDMRWGISDETSITHMATTICLNEVRNCQKLSAGPNFVAFLSHRYGSRCLPTRIIADEFDIIRKELKSQPHLDVKFSATLKNESINMLNILEECYILNENEIPARYRLKFITSIIPGYKLNDKECAVVWSKIEKQLGNLIRSLADICLEKGLLDRTQHERYFVSDALLVTEKEIFNGILNANNVSRNVLLFVREIEDVKEYIDIDKSIAWRYIDVDDNNKLDQPAQTLLSDLTHNKIPKKLPQTNIFSFKVKWAKGKGITQETHPDYMKEFGETFFEQVKKLIDKSQIQALYNDNLDNTDALLIQEVLEHAYFCNQTIEKFHGCSDLLNKMKGYLLSKLKKPLVIFGESGCGKTALLAKLSSEILKSAPDPTNYSVILRFLGTTPSTSNIASALNSVFIQIARIYNINQPYKYLTEDYELKDYFQNQLAIISALRPNKKLVILLDSIDQLNCKDYSLEWLVDELPDNVKIIFSTLPNHGKILDNFRKKNWTDENFLEITELDKLTAIQIITDWLTKDNRTIASHQWCLIDNILSKVKPYPLYVKLIFDTLSKWHSYHHPENDQTFLACKTIDKCIEYLFKQVENDHGKLLVSRALIYMTAFQNGISENEIEDILSIDDDVLYDIFKFHVPPIRKLPRALWSRIKTDLNDYLVEKEIDDTRVLVWYHRRFIEVSNAVYLNQIETKDRDAIFSNILDFFNETWKHKPKPYMYNEYLTKKKKLASSKAEAIRDTSMQPTLFVDGSGNYRVNKRKVRELPNFVLQLNLNLSYVLASEHILFDYEFLYGMFKSNDLRNILEFIMSIKGDATFKLSDEASEAYNSIMIIYFAFLQNLIQMKDHPESISAIILSRVLYYNKHLKYFTKLIAESDQLSSRHCGLTVAYQLMPLISTNCFLSITKHSAPIVATCYAIDNANLIFTLSDKLHLLKIEGVVEMGEITLNSTREPYLEMIIYTKKEGDEIKNSMKDISGGFVLISPHNFSSYSFQSTIYFNKTIDSEILTGVIIVSCNHVAVSYMNKKYFDIYNIFTGELVLRKKFENTIRKIAANSYKSISNSIDRLRSIGFLLVVVTFELGLIKILTSRFSDLRKNSDNSIELELFFEIPRSSYECFDIKFLYETRNSEDFNANGLCISYENGSVLFVDFSRIYNQESKGTASFKYLKLKEQNIGLKLVDYSSNQFLLIGSNGSGFILLRDKMDLYEIKGRFDLALEINSNLLLFVSNSVFHYFLINHFKGGISYVTLSTQNVHLGKVNFLRLDAIFLTSTSEDGSIKISNSCTVCDDMLQIDFDRAENDLKELVPMDINKIASISHDSSNIEIWDLKTGRIRNTICADKFKSESVIQAFSLRNSRLIILSKTPNLNGSSGYSIKGFESTLNNFEYKEQFKVTLQSVFKAKLFIEDTNCLEQLILLSNRNSLPELDIYNFDMEDLDHKQLISLDSSVSKNVIKLSEFMLSNSANASTVDNFGSLLDNVCLMKTHENGKETHLFATFYEHELIIFDPHTRTVLKKKSFIAQDQSISYFLSPTNIPANKLFNLKCFPRSAVIGCVNNVQDLVLMNYDAELNKLSIISSTNMKVGQDFAINSVNDENILLAQEKTSNQLILFNADRIIQTSSIQSGIISRVSLNEGTKISFIGISVDSNYAYSIESNRLLKFYSLKKDMKLIASIPLYGLPVSCHCTSDFMVLSMPDRRVISYLITCPDTPGNLEKIAQLESRCYHDERESKKVRYAVKNLSENFNSSYDRDAESTIYNEKVYTEDDLRDAENKLREIKREKTEDPEAVENIHRLEEDIAYIKRIHQYRADIKTTMKSPLLKQVIPLSKFSRYWMLELLFKENLITESVFEERKILIGLQTTNVEPEIDVQENGNLTESAEFSKSLSDVMAAKARNSTNLRTFNSGRNVSSTNSNASSVACLIQ